MRIALLLCLLLTSCVATEKISFCTFGGAQYAPGESFNDECNVCTCQEDGYVVCTAHECNGACVVDADCPLLPCSGRYCPPAEDNRSPPCSPTICPVNRCIDGRCTSA